jgi:simple sugar transport system permease protein
MLGVATQLLASTFRLATPLLCGAMGGLLCERAGVVNIALEGLMLAGSFGAAVGALYTHSPWTGALCGMLAGALLAAFYGLAVIRFRANQIVAGTAINMLALGLTPFACKALYGVTGQTPTVPMSDRFGAAPLYLVWVVVAACWFLLERTRFGLRLSFAGEHPEALDAAGVQVNAIRWKAVIASGLIAGLGGAALSIFLSSSFSRSMTGGRGFMALAALVFGKWKPIPAALACLLFGFAEALQIRLQAHAVAIPPQLTQALPYVVTILVLAGFVGRSRPPKALGTSWRRQ